jgi:TP901 family phage tail tape measure protein
VPAANVTLRVRATGARAAARDVDATASSVRKLGTAWGGASKKMVGAGKSMKAVGGQLTHGLTIPIVAVGAVASKMAVDYDAAITRIGTQTDATRGDVRLFRREVLDLAKRTPSSPLELANALYRLAGAGLHGAYAMRALHASANLAAVGNANVEDTAKTLGQVLFTNIKNTGGLNHLIGMLNATVGAGDLRLQQLVDALGTGVTASAKTAGLGFNDVSAALAVFGDETNNVSGWSAQLATALHFLYAPTAKSEKALERMGLSGKRLAQDFTRPKGLLVALKDLRSHVRAMPGGIGGVRARQALSSVLPGGRGRVILVLLNQLDRLQSKYEQIARTTNRFGGSLRRTQETPLYRLKTAWSSIQVALIQIGGAVLPVVAPMFQKIARFVGNAADAFQRLSPNTRKMIVIGLGLVAVLGPMLSMIGVLVITIGALASPITLIVLAVGALAAAFIYADKKLGWFHKANIAFYNFIVGLPKTVEGVWHAIERGMASAINAIIDMINSVLKAYNAVAGFFGFGKIGLIGHVHWGEQGKKQRTASASDIMAAQGLVPSAVGSGNQVNAATSPRATHHGRRTRVERTNFPYGASAGGDTHVYVQVDGKTVAKAVHRAGTKAKSGR